MSIVLVGSTSGSITLQEPAVAGSTVLTLPAVTGTVLTTTSPKAGNVIQVVQGIYNTFTSTTSSSFVTSNLSASITPTSSSSKILVFASVPSEAPAVDVQVTTTLYRNSTNLASGISQSAFSGVYSAANAIQAINNLSFLDSPATTSSITYAVYFASTNGGTARLFYNTLTGTITLMEIAG